MKLKDFKKEPGQYNQILAWCKAKGIQANDEDDIFEVYQKIQNADLAYIEEIAKKVISNH